MSFHFGSRSKRSLVNHLATSLSVLLIVIVICGDCYWGFVLTQLLVVSLCVRVCVYTCVALATDSNPDFSVTAKKDPYAFEDDSDDTVDPSVPSLHSSTVGIASAGSSSGGIAASSKLSGGGSSTSSSPTATNAVRTRQLTATGPSATVPPAPPPPPTTSSETSASGPLTIADPVFAIPPASIVGGCAPPLKLRFAKESGQYTLMEQQQQQEQQQQSSVSGEDVVDVAPCTTATTLSSPAPTAHESSDSHTEDRLPSNQTSSTSMSVVIASPTLALGVVTPSSATAAIDVRWVCEGG